MSDQTLVLSHAVERDIDLLLVEELLCSRPFLAWLAKRIWPDAGHGDAKVLHSQRRIENRREIDISVIIREPNSRVSGILVENKLFESPQSGQAESYRAECLRLVADKRCNRAGCILICPKAYREQWCEFSAAFDTVVTYEEIIEEMRRRARAADTEIAARLIHRASVILQAHEGRRRGYVAVEHRAVATFNQAYIELMRSIAPEIMPGPKMKEKSGRPAESVSMIFDHTVTFNSLPVGLRPGRFAHELGNGELHRIHCAAIKWNGWGRAWQRLQPILARDLHGTPYKSRAGKPTLKRPNPGLVIYVPTPPVDNKGGPAAFVRQRPDIEKGIRAANQLRQFVCDNKDLISDWARVASE